MITNLIFDAFNGMIMGILKAIPNVDIGDFPYIGETIQSTLLTVVTTWNAFKDTFPYAELLWNVFLFVIIPFEVGLIILRFFLGNRSPVQTN